MNMNAEDHTHDWDAVDGWQRSTMLRHLDLEHGVRPKTSFVLTEIKNLHENTHSEEGTGRPVPRYDQALSEQMGAPVLIDPNVPEGMVMGFDAGVSSKAMQGWADAAQYRAEPMPQGGRMTVTLLMATPDPLGVIAALCGMYEGRITRNLGDLTDGQRRQALEDMLATELNGPLSAVQFLFLVEGVDRAFTHQAVRQQFAFVAQESLRFAVKEDWASEVPLPPYLAGLAEDDPRVRVWRKALNATEDAYGALVSAGVPAEEARGLLPHAVTTRYYWSVNLKGLLQEAGKRTCTQAQFHWRQMFALVAKALREYGRNSANYWASSERDGPPYGELKSTAWQYETIADLLRPVCYQQGSCGFMAKFDRGCTIRERVDQNAAAGRPSSEWHQALIASVTRPGEAPGREGIVLIPAINVREWAANPGAART